MKLPFSPKKRFGQHFLKNPETAERIADSILPLTNDLLEIGPGTGILTTLLQKKNFNLWINEIDFDAIRFLKENFNFGERIIEGDFLEVNIKDYLENEFSATGNLPYNISSQILFKLLHNRHQVVQIVVMLQKEVAQRIASVPGNRDYGILSVLLQAY